MKRLFVLVAAALAVLALSATPAFATGTTIQWQGHGSENLPCSGNEHWVLSPAQGIKSATLYIDGVAYAMTKNGNGGSYSADTNVGFDGSQSVSVTYYGDTEQAFLKLSHCDSGESTTGGTDGGTAGGDTTGGDTTGGDTTGGDTTGGDTTGGDTTGGDTTGGDTTGGDTTGGDTTGGTTGGGTTGGGTTGGGIAGSTTGGSPEAEVGGELPFTGLPVWVPILLAAALLAGGAILLRRKREEVS
jgi:hypothetical protein